MNILTTSCGNTVLPYCINLERIKDRRLNMDNMCEEHKFPINYLNAFDVNLLLNDDTKQPIKTSKVMCGVDCVDGIMNPLTVISSDPLYRGRKFKHTPPSMIDSKYRAYVTNLYLATLACSMSHMECFRIFYETTNADYLLILEDDASMSGNFTDVLSGILKYQFDICLVGTSPQGKPIASETNNDLLYRPSERWYCGSSAYLMSRTFAARLIPFDIIYFAADEFFGYCQRDMGAELFAMRDPFFGLSSFAKISNCLTSTTSK